MRKTIFLFADDEDDNGYLYTSIPKALDCANENASAGDDLELGEYKLVKRFKVSYPMKPTVTEIKSKA